MKGLKYPIPEYNRITFSTTLEGKEVIAMLCRIRERGQGLVEYAFLLLLIAMVVMAMLLILGPIIGNVFTKLNSSLASF